MHRVVPELIIENYKQGNMSGEFPAVGMFLDLSGFSIMTDALMKHGQHGAEVLASLMHSVFNPLVMSIFGYGGKIVSFAGDGIMALYPVVDSEKITALRAMTSAWIVQQKLYSEPERYTVYGKFLFSVKIGLTAGMVSWRILQSDDGAQATYYFRGSAVDDAAEAESNANAREILLTQRIYDLIKDEADTELHGGFYRLLAIQSILPESASFDASVVDTKVASLFMPERVIVHDMRSEFRQIVNLFMRMPDMSDERLAKFLHAVFNLRKKYGGLLTRLDFGDKGCNMLMLWGAPVAYENDIGRALNFILDLQETVDFPITAGVTYYIAHAGYLGSEMCEDYTCYGWGVNLASRFMMNATDGSIWADERIARRVSQRFEIEYVGSQSFKGFSAEQAVNIVHGRKHSMDTIYQGEMVGRERELKQLKEFIKPLWQGCFAGFIAVTGDGGIGKGRLIHAFISDELFKEKKALWGVCQANQILRQSFNPMLGWLFHYFGISPNQPMDARRQSFDSKLDELLTTIQDPELASELNRTRTILGSLVDVHSDEPLSNQLDAEARYNNTFLAMIALVKAESLRQPLILFVDDFHFADQDTVKFISQLKRSLSASPVAYPVAVVLAFRRQGIDPNLDTTLLDSEISLGGITYDDLSRLAEILLGSTASIELIELVKSRSEGNPYFAEQVIRYLQEENLLEMCSTGWTKVKSGSTVLPADILALLVARLDQLVHEVKNVVQTASILGREFDVRVLAQMLGSDTDAGQYVSEAEKAVIWLPLIEMRYIFYHGLLRDAAYTMQMHAHRKELHALALDVLENLYGENQESRFVEFAHHAELGDIVEKAQKYYTLAGGVSADLFQNEQAVEYYKRALAYTPLDDLTTRFDLVAERVELFSRLGKRDKQLKDLDALKKISERLNDKGRIEKVMMLHSAYYYFIGNYQDAIEYAKQAENLSEFPLDVNKALYTQVVWCTALLRLGRLNEGMQRAQSALEQARVIGNRVEESRILNVMGLIALEQNESPYATKYLVQALEIAREIKNPDVESKAVNNLAMAEGFLNGNYKLAREYYEQSYNIAHKMGDRSAESSALGNLGYAAGMQGDFLAARSYLEKAILVAREVGSLYAEIYTLINLSALDGIQGHPELALQQAQRAFELAQKVADRSGEAWALLYIGHARLQMNGFELAQKAYQASIIIREELDQPSLSMEPIAGLTAVHLARNDLESAALSAEKILLYLSDGSTLDGTEEPLRIYYTCYQYLEKTKDPRFKKILHDANQLLEAQVSKFSEIEARKRYIENIPWRRALHDAAQP